MAGTALLGGLGTHFRGWRVAEVVERRRETPTICSLVLRVEGWEGHRAGQHVDVRLTAADGYQAQRSYSIASAPEQPELILSIDRIADGEVSPYLVDELRTGDRFELRGPVGGYFVWQADDPRPLMLFAGGSGFVPLMAMLRHRAARRAGAPVRALLSARSDEDLLYRAELDGLASADAALDVRYALTRVQPDGWTGYARRVDADMVADIAFDAADDPQSFICGPTAFVEVVAQHLVDLGYDPATVRTERFGPSGA